MQIHNCKKWRFRIALVIVLNVVLSCYLYMYYHAASSASIYVWNPNAVHMQLNHHEATLSLLDELHQHTAINAMTPDAHPMHSDLISASYLYPKPSFMRSGLACLNPVCKHLMPDYVLAFVSHKNGVYLLDDIKFSVHKYCNITGYVRGRNSNTGFFVSSQGKPQYVLTLLSNSRLLQSANRTLKILIQIRNPLDAIWSAYHYHAKCSSDEPWEKTPAWRLRPYSASSQLCCVAPLQFPRCGSPTDVISWDDDRLFDAERDEEYKEQILSSMRNPSAYFGRHPKDGNYCKWLQEIDAAEDAQMGIYVEFVRYINCAFGKNGWRYWKQIFASVQAADMAEFAQIGYFRMNEWLTDFDGTASRLMDLLNLVDDEQNGRILAENGLVDVNISHERDVLLDMMRHRADVAHTWSASKVNKSEHVSVMDDAYQNRKEQAMRWLLSANHICMILKNITLSLHFEWRRYEC